MRPRQTHRILSMWKRGSWAFVSRQQESIIFYEFLINLLQFDITNDILLLNLILQVFWGWAAATVAIGAIGEHFDWWYWMKMPALDSPEGIALR